MRIYLYIYIRLLHHTPRSSPCTLSMDRRHALLVTFPAQGHINPCLQFAKRLIGTGIRVTFATTVHARRRMEKTTGGDVPRGLTYATFSDGYDDGFKASIDDPTNYMAAIRAQGSKAVKDIIVRSAERGCPVTCMVYTLLLPWAAKVAREHRVPRALLWIQPATVMVMYYYYFNGFKEEIVASSDSDDSTWKIQFPGIPLLFSKRDLPSFMLPSSSSAYGFTLPTFKEQFDTLDSQPKPRVLVNTFDALEADALKAIDKYELIGIGPLIPSAFLDGKDPSDKSFGGDLFKASGDCDEWLSSMQKSSVVYVSFGSLLNHEKPQMEEIAKGLQESGRPFLWVIRATGEDSKPKEGEENPLSFLEELDHEKGKIVAWCSQLEVLTHPSLGCFVSHCGWNSTLESISCGVPVVAFPHWTDQGTNANLIEDVWRNGVRVRANEDGMVERGEIRRCIEEVMDGGERSVELRASAAKWKALAGEAMGENGSSNKNLKAFLEEVGAVF